MESPRQENQRNAIPRQLPQDLSSIGLIINTIVHSFNNSIGLIRGYADLSLRATDPDNRIYPYLKNIINGADAMKELSEKMRIFGKQAKKDLQRMRIHSIVEEAVNTFAKSLEPPANIQQDIDVRCGEILADAGQIRQVVVNLCDNAHDATCDNGGEIKVALKEVDVDASFAKAHKGLQEGKYLRLIVGDSGSGMGPEILSRIFEPFFTTKGEERHPGLGLTVVQAIVKNHKGAVFAESKVGDGTRFDIFFPAAE